MKRILLFLMALLCVFGASSALAQDYNTQMYFNGGYQGDVWQGPNGEYVATGFYDGSINGVNVGPGPGSQSPGFICDDYYDNITSGEHWQATGYQVSSLNASNIGQTLFGNAKDWSALGLTAVQGYEALAYLANMMFTTNPNSSTQSSISQAMWYLTSVAAGYSQSSWWNSLTTSAQNLVLMVKNTSNLSALSTYTGLFLYTQPFNPTGPQEMWGQINTLTVPEGGSALAYLLISTLACIGAVWQSRRRMATSPRLS